MESLTLRSGDDYHQLFDSGAYLSGYFSKPDVPFTKFYLSALHDIYTEGKVKGKRIVDIGSGPTIHSLIPAAKWFDELYLSDYCPQNLEAVQKWVGKDPGAHDWQGYFRFFAEKDGNGEAWQQYEDILRSKIKRTLFCDYHQSNPLHPENMGEFDAITMSNALVSGCKDLDQYRSSLNNVVSMLVPGGYFIDVSVLGCPFYVVGGEKFACVSLTKDDILSAVKDAGVEVIKCFEEKFKVEEEMTVLFGALVVFGRKT